MSSPSASTGTATTSTADGGAPGAAGYRGRFAPSPTGPLHRGSLLAALASCLQARAQGGEWLLRIEDIDPPREAPGAADAILGCLDAHGFRWDGPVLFQATRLHRYRALAAELAARGLAYPCTCSRRIVRAGALGAGPLGPVYPGTCRRPERRRAGQRAALRLRSDGAAVHWRDVLLGDFHTDLEREVGDFVIIRADGLVAYALAAVVDDHDSAITEVVRGTDLFPFTAAQVALYRALGWQPPGFLHVPVVRNAAGAKLSKQTGARAVDPARASANLVEALDSLGQSPPPALARAPLEDVWSWAAANWDPARFRPAAAADVARATATV